MKKKLVLVVIFVVGLILFLENVCKISIVNNMKNVIDKQAKMSDSIEEDVTRTDVTGIEPGEEKDHEHLYKTVYDENKHWEECMACGKKRNESVHSYTRTWASGKESCNSNNYYTDSCSCGYYLEGRKPCVWNGNKYTAVGYAAVHAKMCSVCEHNIKYSYYYNGKLYKNEYPNEECVHNGKKVNCLNPGTCDKCKITYKYSTHRVSVDAERKEIYCKECKKIFGKYSNDIIEIAGVPAKYKVETHIVFQNGMTFSQARGMRDAGEQWTTNTSSLKKGSIGGTDVTLITEAQFKSTWKTEYMSYVSILGKISGELVHITLTFDTENSVLYPDSISPEIASIVTNNEELLTTWSRTKPIIISGTENYCNTVNVEIIDDDGNVFFTGSSVVTSGSYTISCTPELEVDANGKRFKAIVTDACNNETEQEFEIARVDAIAPQITSGDELEGEWAKSKKITFSANDYGIGEVQIGFNSSDDYVLASKDGQSYSREYELFGDVYEPREANVYYKDGLGNISTKKIIIDKLDNTAPTITNVNIHNNKLTVEANDIHEIWGEGSGIVRYRYLSSGNKISNIDILEFTSEVDVEDNIVIPNLPEVKYVYVVAEDLVRKCK